MCLLSNPSHTRVYEILWRSHSIPWGPYALSAMGMPGSETRLEEVMSCVLEILFTKELLPRSPTIYTAEPTHQRSYCRTGNKCTRPSPSSTSNSLLPKLVINPKSIVVLAWIWDSGTLQASLHQIATLAVLQQAQNSWPPKVLYWCIQSLGLHYTPVLHITVTT